MKKTLCFTCTEFAPPFMGYLCGLGKMGRGERGKASSSLLVRILGETLEAPVCISVAFFVI